jgi:hypothetical protein
MYKHVKVRLLPTASFAFWNIPLFDTAESSVNEALENGVASDMCCLTATPTQTPINLQDNNVENWKS